MVNRFLRRFMKTFLSIFMYSNVKSSWPTPQDCPPIYTKSWCQIVCEKILKHFFCFFTCVCVWNFTPHCGPILPEGSWFAQTGIFTIYEYNYLSILVDLIREYFLHFPCILKILRWAQKIIKMIIIRINLFKRFIFQSKQLYHL